jgi:hypothetical protein
MNVLNSSCAAEPLQEESSAIFLNYQDLHFLACLPVGRSVSLR